MPVVHPKFLVLKRRFLDSLPDRIGSINGLVMRGQRENFDPQTIEELARQLHTLTGTAGCYGLDDISFAAAEGEALITGGMDPSDFGYLETIIGDMRSIAASHVEISYLGLAEGF